MSTEHAMSAEEVTAFLEKCFPAATEFASILKIGEGRATLESKHVPSQLRPGGTVSGPTMMTLADTAAYVLVLSMLGPVALAVTTHLSIDFLRKPPPGEVRAEARMLKLGKRLAVMSVELEAEGMNGPVAFANVTCSIPPR